MTILPFDGRMHISLGLIVKLKIIDIHDSFGYASLYGIVAETRIQRAAENIVKNIYSYGRERFNLARDLPIYGLTHDKPSIVSMAMIACLPQRSTWPDHATHDS